MGAGNLEFRRAAAIYQPIWSPVRVSVITSITPAIAEHAHVEQVQQQKYRSSLILFSAANDKGIVISRVFTPDTSHTNGRLYANSRAEKGI